MLTDQRKPGPPAAREWDGSDRRLTEAESARILEDAADHYGYTLRAPPAPKGEA